jgi:IPT/TIG domain-containing protein
MLKRARLAAIPALLAAGLLMGGLVPQVQAAGGSRTSTFRPVSVGLAGRITVRNLPSGTAVEAARQLPVRRINLSGGSRAGGTSPKVVETSTATSAGPTLTIAGQFPLVSLDQQMSSGLPNNQFVAPPDTQLAAGDGYLVEMVNDSGSIWTKKGALVNKVFDLNVFFMVPSGQTFSDPRVVYDTLSGRWFASGLSFTSSLGSQVYVAVSSTSDPTGSWNIYPAAASSNVLHDQPKLGVSSDKVVESWNDFPSGAYFSGSETWAFQKSDLLSASSTLHAAAEGPDSSKPSIAPAQDLSTDSTEYLAFDTSTTLALLVLIGTPLNGGVSWTEDDLAIGSISDAPSADQPGAPGSIDTNDDRLLNAVWQSGFLWTGANDTCTPPGDTATRPCVRLIEVATGTPAIATNVDLGYTGGDVYYPAVTVDGSGDLFAVYNLSSTVLYVGVRTISEQGGTFSGGQTIRAGDNVVYNDNSCYSRTGPSRWGDYSGAAIDADNPSNVWVAGEFAATSSLTATNSCAWATYAATLTVGSTSPPPAPSVTGVSPGTGPTAGGTSVSITGTGFTGATAVSFGSTKASFTVSSDTLITATSPAECAGTVDVTVTNAGGTSTTSSADNFKYVAPTPVVKSISPTSGSTKGGTQVTITGTGFTCATSVSFGTVAASSFTVTSDTQISAVSPAESPGTADVTVTTAGGTSANSSADQFTYRRRK